MARAATASGYFKRGNTYYVRTDPLTGRSRSTGKGTLREAREWYAVRERLAEDPSWIGGAQLSLGAALDELIAYQSHRVAEGTVDYYQGKRRALETILGADTPVAAVRPGDVDKFVSARRQAGIGESTIWQEVSLLRRALRMAKRSGRYPHDIGELMPQDLHQTYEPRTRALSITDVERLFGAILAMKSKRGTEKGRAAKVATLKLAIALGVRPGELWRFRPEHFDLKARTVAIPGTKNKGARAVVPILECFDEWVKEAVPCLPLPRWGNASRDLRRIGDSLDPKIPPFSLRDLRRSFASALVSSGVDREVVRRLLRHVDSRMVERVYGQMTPDSLRTLAEAHVTKTSHGRGLSRPNRA